MARVFQKKAFKKKKKRGWGRQAKPFELLPVLSKVPRERVEGAGPQKILRLCLTLRLVSQPSVPTPTINTVDTHFVDFLLFRREDSYLFKEEKVQHILILCIQTRIFCILFVPT